MTHQLQQFTAEYGPLLDDLKTKLDTGLGPLTWSEREDAKLTTNHLNEPVMQAGMYRASGVNVPFIDRLRITKDMNAVLYEHDFPEQPEITGSSSGHLVFESTDGAHAKLTVLIKMGVDMWVEKPVK